MFSTNSIESLSYILIISTRFWDINKFWFPKKVKFISEIKNMFLFILSRNLCLNSKVRIKISHFLTRSGTPHLASCWFCLFVKTPPPHSPPCDTMWCVGLLPHPLPLKESCVCEQPLMNKQYFVNSLNLSPPPPTNRQFLEMLSWQVQRLSDFKYIYIVVLFLKSWAF